MAKMSEEQMVQTVRNALVIAGREMGEDGDHWPVIKSTVNSILQDWEDLKIERNVNTELRIHLYGYLGEMERDATARNDKATLEKLRTLREVYDAYFSPVAPEAVDMNSPEIPDYIKRAQHIIETLEEEND